MKIKSEGKIKYDFNPDDIAPNEVSVVILFKHGKKLPVKEKNHGSNSIIGCTIAQKTCKDGEVYYEGKVPDFSFYFKNDIDNKESRVTAVFIYFICSISNRYGEVIHQSEPFVVSK